MNYEIIDLRQKDFEEKHPKKRNNAFKKGGKILFSTLALTGLMLGSGYIGARLASTNEEILMQNVSVAIEELVPIAAPISTTIVQDTSSITSPITSVFAAANPAVVAISTESIGRNIFGQQVSVPSAGSGFAISSTGYIVTNDHVIANANRITVYLYDERSYDAIVVGRDSRNDLAVLKIEPIDPLEYLAFASSQELLIGEQVMAIGNPLGELANTMTMGHISALDRSITIDGIEISMLQTDAALNRGNSGGPLINMAGNVVGVVTAKAGTAGAEGIGFAIPANAAAEIVNNIIEGGQNNHRPVLGIIVSTNMDTFGRPFVRVEEVASGSGAYEADIKEGDILIAAKGLRIDTAEDVLGIINELSVGDLLEIVVVRQGEMMLKSVHLKS